MSDFPNARDCEHGFPATQCRECFLSRELARKDAKIAEQAAEIQALVNRQAAKDEEIERWERKEIKRACDCHGQEQRAVKAERERDEARKALVWVEDNIQSIDLKEPVEEPLEKWRKE